MFRFLIIFLSSVFTLQAQEETKQHYFYAGAGYMLTAYGKPLDARTHFAGGVQEVTHIPLCLDPVGYYFRKTYRLLIGGIAQIHFDRYSAYGNRLQIEFYQPSASMMYFADVQIGKGLFFRSDAGPVLHRLSGTGFRSNVKIGYGALAAVGFGLEMFSRRVLWSADFSIKRIGSAYHRLIGFGGGILF
ncbi:MAG: hypothetical protein KDC45_09525 [Bacteroidetes bacterium]|nr:hypothetical protein [Bacteroidota bacterium]